MVIAFETVLAAFPVRKQKVYRGNVELRRVPDEARRATRRIGMFDGGLRFSVKTRSFCSFGP
jgi:hypothetical protein